MRRTGRLRNHAASSGGSLDSCECSVRRVDRHRKVLNSRNEIANPRKVIQQESTSRVGDGKFGEGVLHEVSFGRRRCKRQTDRNGFETPMPVVSRLDRNAASGDARRQHDHVACKSRECRFARLWAPSDDKIDVADELPHH